MNITFSEGTSTLNGNNFTSGSVINKIGSYELIVTNSLGTQTVNFSVVDTSFPVVSDVSNGGIYNSKSGKKAVYFDKGTATVNGISFLSGSSIGATGNYKLIVSSSNVTTVDFTYIKYGDVTGDGAVDITDLALLKKHLLKSSELSGPFMQAGDVFSKGYISISDLIAIKKHLLQISMIQ